MAKKDFTQVNTDSVYDTIAQATQLEGWKPMGDRISGKRKERRTYSKEEEQQILETMQTSGRKGIKLPRINLAFSPANYDYVVTMSRVRGENLTQFVNHILQEHREEHDDVYQKALEFRNSL